MKKQSVFAVLLAFLCLLSVFIFAACDDESTAPTCQHRDADDNAICDNCGENFTDAVDSKIGFKTLAVNGTVVYGKVSNATTSFSFLDEISILGNATFKVFRDLECKDLIESKTATLNSGDNTFYVLEYIGDEVNTLYTVTVRRKPMHTVTFDTADGTWVPTQTVEEDTLATRPADPKRMGYTFADWAYDFTTPVTGDVTVVANWQGNPYTATYDANGGAVTTPTLVVTLGEGYTLASPTRVGYTFAGWYKDSTPVPLTGTWHFSENTTLVAEWTPNSGIPYKVEHYTENLDGTWALQDTDNLFGTSDRQVTPATKSYTGFTAPTRLTVTVAPDGTLVVRYEYKRNSYTITFVTNGGDAIAAYSIKYGATLPTPVRTGYTFGGWFTNVALTAAVTTVPANNTTVYAYWAEETKAGDFRYSGSTITDYQASDTSVVIPAYIGGKLVTSIGNSAFSICRGLTSISIPSSVTSIGDDAFRGCRDLKSVTFGENSQLTSIGNSVFSSCMGLTAITIPAGVTSIGEYAFSGCTRLTSISIPSSVTSIGDWAFYYCTGLQSVTFGENSKLTSIGEDAFYYCTGLTAITIPASVTSIGKYAFRGCTGLTSMTLPFVGASLNGTSNTHFGYIFGASSFSYNDDYVPTSLKAVVITGGSTIGASAFYYCMGLTAITIPAGVTSIGEDAFYYCMGLTAITIPASVTSIGKYAFRGCTGLQTVTFGENSQLTSIGEDAFAWCGGLTAITIPASVTSIGEDAFYYCTGLIQKENGVSYVDRWVIDYYNSTVTTVTLRENTVGISDSAFAWCGGLTAITIPASVTSIGYEAFYYCTDLQSVIFGENSQLTSIGNSAFSSCMGLTSITIPASVTSIGYEAFYGCSGLTSITVNSGNTVYHSAGNCLIKTASKTLILGCNTSVIPTDGSVTSIDDYAFYHCAGLTSITIPDSVTSIGYEAFYGCSGLQSVTFANTAGWYASSSTGTNGTAISASSLANLATAARYLTDTYYEYYWKRA